MSTTKQLLIVAAAALLAVGVWWVATATTGDGSGTDAQAGGPPRSNGQGAPVIVQPVAFETDASLIEAVGTARAQRSVVLYPQAAGQVTAVEFEAEQQVPTGTVLLRLDDEAERLALELAQLQLENARQQLARHERVAGSGAVAETAVDDMRTAMAVARIAVAQARVDLANRQLQAPFAGVVGIPLVDVGDRVTESTAIAAFDDRKALLIDFAIPELFAQGLALGHAVRVRSWALPDVEVPGQVVAMESRIDPATRTLRIQARVPNQDDRFRPGTSFAVRLQLGDRRFPAVPAGALQWDRDGAYVWRVADGRAARVNVRVLKRGGGWVLVDGALAAGEQIVVEGVQRLRPDLPVRVSSPATSRTEGADGQ